VGVACAVLAGLALGAFHLLFARDRAVASRPLEALLLLGVIAVLAVAYFLVSSALGIAEARTVVARVRGRRPDRPAV
jgi:hypothetical protein